MKPRVKSWMENYAEALTELVLSQGRPMDLTEDRHGPNQLAPNYYGWTNFEIYWHFTNNQQMRDGTDRTEACVAFATTSTVIEEQSYDQFEGTDWTGETMHHFIVLTHVNCGCGKHKDMTWAWDGTRSDAILAVTKGKL